ncbi:MAG: hypothetical protein AB1505_08765 [Candidatus Latescibacterota bacterium]
MSVRLLDRPGRGSVPPSGFPAGAPLGLNRAARRSVAQQQARQAESALRQRILERVDVLVDAMEGLAERIASPRTSAPRRSVLVGRFNELRRQVNRVDGIVGSEGREAEPAAGLTDAQGAPAARAEPEQRAPGLGRGRQAEPGGPQTDLQEERGPLKAAQAPAGVPPQASASVAAAAPDSEGRLRASATPQTPTGSAMGTLLDLEA